MEGKGGEVETSWDWEFRVKGLGCEMSRDGEHYHAGHHFPCRLGRRLFIGSLLAVLTWCWAMICHGNSYLYWVMSRKGMANML